MTANQKICTECGCPFETVSNDDTVCSEDCYDSEWQRNEAEGVFPDEESPKLPEPKAPPAGQSIQSTNMLNLFRQMVPRM